MKKLLIVAALALASLFGGMSAASAAGIDVCVNLNVNGTEHGPGCQNIAVPGLPA